MTNNKTKLGLGVLALLAVVVAWNFVGNDAASAFRPKKQPKPVDLSVSPKEAGSKLPKSLGPAKAPVTIQIFLNGSNSCHLPSVEALKNVVKTYPNEVRVEVLDTRDPKNQTAADKAKIGCETGLTINGRSVFRLPGKGAVTFTGPIESGKHFAESELAEVIDRIILEKTGKPAAHAKVPDQEVAQSPHTYPGAPAAGTSPATPSAAGPPH